MAESWQQAFGRYLKTLRMRKGLSLQEVCSLSQAFAQTIEKGYLSRCENGYQGPSFAKIIPLSRIYGVAADVLLERLELDMELDKVGSPETEGLSFSELTLAAADCSRSGTRWNAYAFARAAIERASTDTPSQTFRDNEEQLAAAHMTCGSTGMALGRRKFALHEFRYVERSHQFGDRLSAILCERLAVVMRHIGDNDNARSYTVRALELAEKVGEREYVGHIYSNYAIQAQSDRDLQTATYYFELAFAAYKKAGVTGELGRCMTNLAQVHFELGREGAARRALASARRYCQQPGGHRSVALGEILLGDMDILKDRQMLAERHWKEAAGIAKQLNDKLLRFRAEFRLFQLAHESGNKPVARSIKRRLERLSNWIPERTPELEGFLAIVPRRN